MSNCKYPHCDCSPYEGFKEEKCRVKKEERRRRDEVVAAQGVGDDYDQRGEGGGSKSELLRDHKQALAEWKEKHFHDTPKIGEELATPAPSPAPTGSDSGLVEELENRAKVLDGGPLPQMNAAQAMREAAAEIRRLTAERDKRISIEKYHGRGIVEWHKLFEAAEARAEQAERERDEAKAAHEVTAENYHNALAMHEASEARVKELREALERIRTYGGDYTTGEGHQECRQIAIAVLTKETKGSPEQKINS